MPGGHRGRGPEITSGTARRSRTARVSWPRLAAPWYSAGALRYSQACPHLVGGCTLTAVAWVKVPPENHPRFRAALPHDPRVETLAMFGGVAAKVNGHVFAGLFGRSTMVWLNDSDRKAALARWIAKAFDAAAALPAKTKASARKKGKSPAAPRK